MSLGDHLRADEVGELVAGESIQQLREAAAPTNRVAIDPADSRVREQARDLCLHAFRAEADLLQIRSGTLRALPRNVAPEVTVMTSRAPVPSAGVHGERHAT